jgi:outer membrane protein assembly factor BamB
MLKRWAWCVVALLLSAGGLAVAEGNAFRPQPFDWPQWQGPERTAVSRETGLLQEWPKGGPPLAWKVKGLGQGYSTPSVAAGRLFTMGNRDNAKKEKREYVLALDERDGKELWAAEVGPAITNVGSPGPRCTPTVDGDRVYALGVDGDLVCLETATGKELWRKRLKKDFEGHVGGWGYSESPLIDGDKLVCTPGGKKALLVALNKADGSVLWKCEGPGGLSAAYSSVIAADIDGQRQYIQLMNGVVVGVRADDGKFLWRTKHPLADIACSTPVVHDNYVFAATSYGKGGGLTKLTRDGDTTKAEDLYFTKDMKNHHGGMILVDGYLYGSDEGLLTCLEFTSGKVMWQERAPGKGSIALADGRLYYRNEGGPIFLVEVNPQKYVEHGQFKQPDRSGEPAWPHPVIANGKLYIRDQDVLLCYDVKRR